MRAKTLRMVMATVFCMAFTPAQAMGPETYEVDSIFELSEVSSISLSGTGGHLAVTMPNKILQFSTFPLNVTVDVDVPIEGNVAVITQDRTLVALGDDVDLVTDDPGATNKSQRRRSRGTVLLYRNAPMSLQGDVTPIAYPLESKPFSQALLFDDDKIFAVNPGNTTVYQLSVRNMISAWDEPEKGPYRINELRLSCGTAVHISVFEDKEVEYYVTSVIGSKSIEIGQVKAANRKDSFSECYAPYGSGLRAVKELRATNQQSLLHELIDNPWGGYDEGQFAKHLLLFDPDSDEISVFPLRRSAEQLTVLRSESYGIDLTDRFDAAGAPDGRFGLMSASNDGSVILLSHVGSNVVHRLSRKDRDLIYRGQTTFEKPVKMLEVSDDGSVAAAVVGDSRRGTPEEIIVVKSPALILGSGRLSRQRFSVISMQKLLKEQGFSLVVDGIYGGQTQKAIDAYLIKQREIQSGMVAQEQGTPQVGSATTEMSNSNLLGAVVVQQDSQNDLSGAMIGNAQPSRLVPNLNAATAKPSLTSGAVRQNIRGLFPLSEGGANR